VHKGRIYCSRLNRFGSRITTNLWSGETKRCCSLAYVSSSINSTHWRIESIAAIAMNLTLLCTILMILRDKAVQYIGFLSTRPSMLRTDESNVAQQSQRIYFEDLNESIIQRDEIARSISPSTSSCINFTHRRSVSVAAVPKYLTRGPHQNERPEG
jgi:hypothetical protein